MEIKFVKFKFMKKSIIYISIVLVILNTIIGLIIKDYESFKIVFADASIVLSSILIYLLFNLKTADGFKIGFSIFFIFSGLVRFICSIISPNEINNNIPLLIFIMCLAIEVIFYFVSKNLNNN